MPVALALLFFAVIVPRSDLGIDFRASFWPAARAVANGETPYPPLDAGVLARGAAFVYPPIVALALAPLGLVPIGLATAIMVVATGLAVVATLGVLGVRDWRCYGATLGSPAVLSCLQTAALSAFLALAVAVAWRCRHRGWATPVLVAAAIVVKLFLWPLLVWLYVVRGRRCAAGTAVACAVVVVLPFLLGFPGGSSYLPLLRMVTDVQARSGYTPRALALSLSAPSIVAEAIAATLGVAAIALALALARTPRADRRTLALTLLAGLLASPIVWPHYLVVLIPLMALVSRRLHWIWLAGWGLWLAGGIARMPSSSQITVALAVMTIIAGRAATDGTDADAIRSAGAWCVLRLQRISSGAVPFRRR